MKLRPLSKRERTILYLTLAIFVATVLYNVLLTPLLSRLYDINSEIDAKISLLRRHSRLIGKGEDILSIYESYKQVLQTSVGLEEIETVFYKEIKSFAVNSRLSLERIRPQPVQDKKGYKEVFLEVELVGNLDSIFEFINRVENSASFMRIASIRISPQTAASRQLRCRIVLAKVSF